VTGTSLTSDFSPLFIPGILIRNGLPINPEGPHLYLNVSAFSVEELEVAKHINEVPTYAQGEVAQ